MKERFPLVRTAYPERRTGRQHAVVFGRLYRRIGRACLLGAAICAGVDVFNSVQGYSLPPVTLRSVLDLSPLVTGPSVAPTMKVAIGLAVDSPLWALLIILAAVPYALAIERFLKAQF